MIGLLEEHERTMAFAEVALGQIPAPDGGAAQLRNLVRLRDGLQLGAGQIINETLARNGKITEAELEQIYEPYLPKSKQPTHRPGGSRVINEIDDVMTLMQDALGMTTASTPVLGAQRKSSTRPKTAIR